jgi:tetratricopeptide (TPR) repeat protein
LIGQLEAGAIHAARMLGDREHLAIFLGDKGHNLHRQGFHQQAIESFEASSLHYAALGRATYVQRNTHMTALCYRALNQWERAHTICQNILSQLPEDDPWRGHPLQVLAWLYRDKAEWKIAEVYLRGALDLFVQSQDSDILVAGTLADLGEILGVQERFEAAKDAFARSLGMLAKHKGQYIRQEARTMLKFASMLTAQGDYEMALHLLREADERCCMYGHYYDALWKVEMAVADIFLRQWQFHRAGMKIMSALHLRHALGLRHRWLAQQMFVRVTTRLVKNPVKRRAA